MQGKGEGKEITGSQLFIIYYIEHYIGRDKKVCVETNCFSALFKVQLTTFWRFLLRKISIHRYVSFITATSFQCTNYFSEAILTVDAQ